MDGDMRELLRVEPERGELSRIDPRATPGLPADADKTWADGQLRELGVELARQQEMLYATAKVAPAGSAQARRRLLVVLQGMDCSGKGGTVKRVVGAMNPIGVRVVAFGPPTERERSEHFLARVSRALPDHGQVGVFDRSHYEDVLIARVRSLVPASTWQSRFDEINQWEAKLVAAGTPVLKVMLHLSYQEQARRLRARLDNPTKHWKFDPADIDERARWGDYQSAYQEVLARCGTDVAPWYVVPADRKWYRNWAVAQLVLAAFTDLGLSYPEADFDVAAQRRRLADAAGDRLDG